ENRRLQEIRRIVLTATNNVPIKVGDVVEGGRHANTDPQQRRGVVVGNQTRAGRVAASEPKLDENGKQIVDPATGQRQWVASGGVVQGIVPLRKGEKSLPALADVEKKIADLNEPGQLLPGIKLDTFYDRTVLINLTTHTVRENVLVGIGLVVIILWIF